MNSLYYGLALIAILLIVQWYILNDGEGQDDGSLGFLATKSAQPQTKPDPGKPAAKRSFRRRS